MPTTAEKIKAQVHELITTGYKINYGLAYKYADAQTKKRIEKEKIDFESNYENWYSESRILIKQLLPDRLKDFDDYYKLEKRKEVDYLTYTVSDALISLTIRRLGDVICDSKAAIPKLTGQIHILESAEKAIDGLLFNLRTVIQADLFDSELEEAKVLNRNGYFRAAGAVVGVVLEKHLTELLDKRNITITKKNSCIGDLNELLKSNGVIEIKDWRYIQHLADIRNLCDHKRAKDPTKEDIEDLISGTEKVIKTIT